MIKKAFESIKPHERQRKFDLIRTWLQANPLNGRLWDEVKHDIKSYLEKNGQTFHECTDYERFTKNGFEKDQVSVAPQGDKATVDESLKQLLALIPNLNSVVFANAISVIEQCGGVDAAKPLSAKWTKLVDDIGEDSARKAIQWTG